MSSVVIDASVALAWAFPDKGNEYAERVLATLQGRTIFVPAVWALEIANALLVGERRKRLRRPDALRFVALLGALPIGEDHQAVSENVARVLPLALEHGLSAYDAAYLELALRKNASLSTLDGNLRKAAKRSGIELLT